MTDIVVCYIGHGGFLNDQSYLLLLRSTEDKFEFATALRMQDLMATLLPNVRHRRLYVLLDCCFAGEAIPLAQGPIDELIERQIGKGVTFLNASSKQSVAVVPKGGTLPMFSEALCHVLSTGVPDGGDRLSLRSIRDGMVSYLASTYPDEFVSWPEIHSPRQEAGRELSEFQLLPNPAHTGANGIPPHLLEEISEYARVNWDDETYQTLERHKLPFSDGVIQLRTTLSEDEQRIYGQAAWERYIAGGANRLSLTDCYAIASKLVTAILADDVSAFRHRQFVYPIHQYLSRLVVSNPERKQLCSRRYTQWLSDVDGTYATTRDFAAFQIGMCGMVEAESYLVEALRNPLETPAVRYYSALSLGMLRSSRRLADLARVFRDLPEGVINIPVRVS
ncbi:MAG: hypothetical protein AB7K71_27005 [Polyangiaceae bacterium]